MTTDAALISTLEAALGVSVRELRPVRGGDICSAFEARLPDGESVFVKTHPGGAAMLQAEAHGLRWLQEAEAIEVPEVLAVMGAPCPMLALRFVHSAAPAREHDEQLGRALARLHGASAPSFGLERDNFIATLAQSNASLSSWPAFYWHRRLQPLCRRALDEGLLADTDRAALERLGERLLRDEPELVGDPEPPARLHGDLWSGNAITNARGGPVLVDPSVYAGHREIDLAMMRLFGGFGPRCFAAYEEVAPLQPSWRERVPLYQLYPLLVHLCLFGRGYVGQLRAALRAVTR